MAAKKNSSKAAKSKIKQVPSKSSSRKDSAKKAPVKPENFEDLIARHSDEVQAVANRLRDLVREVLPEADENIYGGEKVGMALYSIGGADNLVCGIGLGSYYCLLFVHNINELTHPELRLEGRGKSNRHIKFFEVEEIDPRSVKWLIGEANRLRRK